MLLGEIKKWLCNSNYIVVLMFILVFQISHFGWSIIGNKNNVCDYRAYREFSAEINSKNSVKIQKDLEEKLAPERLYQTDGLQIEYTNSVEKEEILYRVVLRELKQLSGYSDYLSQIVNAENTSVSIFSLSEYSNRDNKLTAKAYSSLKDTDMRYGRNYGCYRLSVMGIDDIFCLVLFLLIVVSIVTVEREKMTVLLLRALPKGRKEVSMAKYIGGFILSLFFILVFYGVKMLIILKTYGLGDLSVPVQSVYGMQASPFPLSVGEYLFVFLLLKIMIGELIYSILFLIAASFQASLQVYGFSIVILAIEYVLFTLVGRTSHFVLLHDFNIFYFWNTSELLIGYHNINFFGKPLPYSILCVLIICCGLVLATVIGIGKNSRFRILECNRVGKAKKTRKKKYRKIGIFRLLLHGEANKCWLCEKGFLVLLLSILFGLLFSSSVKEDLSSDEKAFYKGYISEVEGTFTEEKINYLLTEEKRLEQIAERMNQEGITDDALQVFQNDLRHLDGLEPAISYGKYLQKNQGLSFIYSSGYQRILTGEEGRWNRMLRNLIAIFMMAGLSVSVWGIEEWSGMKQLIQISKQGKKCIYKFKLKITIINGIIVLLVVYLPGIYQVFLEYGCTNILAPVRSIQEYSMLPGWMNILSVILLFYFIHLVMIWGVGYVSRFIQKRMQSHIVSTIVTVLLCGIMALLISV